MLVHVKIQQSFQWNVFSRQKSFDRVAKPPNMIGLTQVSQYEHLRWVYIISKEQQMIGIMVSN